jgi:hypothetical protein
MMAFAERLERSPESIHDPEWTSGEGLPQDWIDFIAGVIERSRKLREYVEAAPHQLEQA